MPRFPRVAPFYAAVGVVLAAAPALAQDNPLQVSMEAREQLTSTVVTPGNPNATPPGSFPTAPGNPDDPRYRAVYGGGNGTWDAVVSLRIVTPQGVFGCSGSLLPNRRQILTAAHCVTNGSNVVTASSVDVRFQGSNNSTSPFAATITVPGGGVRVNPAYTGLVVASADVAILDLPTEAPSFATTLDLYNGPPAAVLGQQYTIIGYGSTGTGQTGDQQPGFAFARRYGYNRMDATANPGASPNTVDFTSDATGSIWISDFDNGTSNADTICRIFGNPVSNTQLCNQGYPTDLANPASVGEVGVGRGDSGGPAIFNGQVIGVASWGGQFFNNGFPQFGFGTIYGHTNLLASVNATWLRANIIPPQQVIPEPGTYALVGGGLLLFGAFRRRQQKQAA